MYKEVPTTCCLLHACETREKFTRIFSDLGISERVSFRTVVSEAVSFGGLKPGRCSWITRLPGGHALARQVLAGTRQARGPLAPLPLPAVLHWILIQCSTQAQHLSWAVAGQQCAAVTLFCF